jgi:hypothetical protein
MFNYKGEGLSIKKFKQVRLTTTKALGKSTLELASYINHESLL